MHLKLAVSIAVRPRGREIQLALVDNNNNLVKELDINKFKLSTLVGSPVEATELLFLSAAIYALDKFTSRKEASDSWTREISLSFPVSCPDKWQPIIPTINLCLSFLTGDLIDIHVYNSDVIFETPLSPELRPYSLYDSVCLFSGGLDSLVGAIDLLEANPEKKYILLSHYDGNISGPKKAQDTLLRILAGQYNDRFLSIPHRVGMKGRANEKTYRSRSFLFLCMGVFIASKIGYNSPVYLPENGTIALNVPLTPSRRGSCSTRTAHPNFVSLFNEIIRALDINNLVINPLMSKSKGSVVASCLNPSLLTSIAHLSVSCARYNRKTKWKRRNAKQCGRCMPCIYRRAALHKISLDSEIYGNDICLGEVPLNSEEIGSNDFRACISFLKKDLSEKEIASLLIAGGLTDLYELDQYCAVVQDAFTEIRTLLRDKATESIKSAAGI